MNTDPRQNLNAIPALAPAGLFGGNLTEQSARRAELKRQAERLLGGAKKVVLRPREPAKVIPLAREIQQLAAAGQSQQASAQFDAMLAGNEFDVAGFFYGGTEIKDAAGNVVGQMQDGDALLPADRFIDGG